MAFVRQTHKSDCGIAALAMLCDVTYEDAKEAITWGEKHSGFDTYTKQLRVAAILLGYRTKSTPKNHLKVVHAPKIWAPIRCAPNTSDWWYLIPANSLVKIKRDDGDPRGHHWVVWRKNKIYDPARGVFHPSKHGAKPLSYMQFIEADDPCPECGHDLKAQWSGVKCSNCKYWFCY